MQRDEETIRISDRIRFEHIRLAANDVLSMSGARGRNDLDDDMLFRRALIHAIQEIGEAAARVSDSGRSLLPEVPWGKIVRTRHIMVHDYFGVDLDTVWRIAQEHVPHLPALMDRAIEQLPLPPDIEPLK